MQRIDVVIAAHNGARHLEASLSAFGASEAVAIRLIVVDNASVDDSVAIARDHAARVVELPVNVGYGAACNEGLALAEAEWVAFANQDVVVAPDALQRLLAACDAFEGRERRPVVGGPLLLDVEGRASSGCHRLPSLPRQIIGLMTSERVAGVRYRRRTLRMRTCGWVDGALLLGRASTFRAIGGFDVRYFMYVEDVDLFARLAESGARCLWVPAATVVHHGGRRPLAPELHAGALRNWSLYFRARAGPAAGATVLTAGVLGSVARGLAWRLRSLGNAPEARAWATMFLEGARIVLRSRPTQSEKVR
ncbi:MAG: glycosyltransferase family 2 protein [Acidimicrobiales bacterium]